MDQPGGRECAGAWHVLCCMWMVLPNQAGSLQGPHGASRDVLAVEDLGIGSGWPQNKQNWALPAVMGSWTRMQHSCLCCVQSTPPPAASFPLPRYWESLVSAFLQSLGSLGSPIAAPCEFRAQSDSLSKSACSSGRSIPLNRLSLL